MRVARIACVAAAGVLIAAAGAGAVRPSAPSTLSTLLARYRPIVVLHPAERFQPVAVEGFLADSDLERPVPTGW